MSSWLPNVSILTLWLLFLGARFENQRWIRARMRGMCGSSAVAGFAVDLTGAIGLLFALLFLLAYGYDSGLFSALTLFVLGVVGSPALGFIIPEYFFIWLLGSIAVWPLMLMLGRTVTRFGLFQ